MKLSCVKVILWDFDNTLYHGYPELNQAVREAEITTIMKHTGWDYAKACEQFNAIYKRIFGSATAASAHLSGITFIEAAAEMENYFDRTKYLKPDPKLVEMFKSLSVYRHFIFTNGIIAKIKAGLNALGVPLSTFEDYYSSEISGYNKPDILAYEYILHETGIPAQMHLMVGDRDEVDVIPPKSLGINTCLVWGESSVADYSLPTVYQVPEILA